jgi:hypothetical protein
MSSQLLDNSRAPILESVHPRWIVVPIISKGMTKSSPVIPNVRLLSVGSSETIHPLCCIWLGLTKLTCMFLPYHKTWFNRRINVSPVSESVRQSRRSRSSHQLWVGTRPNTGSRHSVHLSTRQCKNWGQPHTCRHAELTVVEVLRCPNTRVVLDIGVDSQSLRRGPKRLSLCPLQTDDNGCEAMVEFDASYSTVSVGLLPFALAAGTFLGTLVLVGESCPP